MGDVSSSRVPATTPPARPKRRRRRVVVTAITLGAFAGAVAADVNMSPMLSGLAALLPDGAALSFVDRSGVATPVTIEPRGVAVAGNVAVDVGARKKITGMPIAVLQDEWTASSGEAVLASLRGVDGVRTFGADSAGYTSANVSRTLFDGATIVLTESVYVDRTGRNYDEGPIAPDQNSTDADADARAWLSEQGCTG